MGVIQEDVPRIKAKRALAGRPIIHPTFSVQLCCPAIMSSYLAATKASA